MAKRGGYPGMGGGMNMNNMMKQVQKMQKQMEEQQKVLEESEYTATAGGGAVEVTVTGKKVVTKIKLDPDAVDPDDVEMLEDLIMAAVNEAMKKVDTATDEMMDKFSGGGMPGMGGIPGMGGMGGFPF
jgi:DNA-binding YbaB/EbfC family protein